MTLGPGGRVGDVVSGLSPGPVCLAAPPAAAVRAGPGGCRLTASELTETAGPGPALIGAVAVAAGSGPCRTAARVDGRLPVTANCTGARHGHTALSSTVRQRRPI